MISNEEEFFLAVGNISKCCGGYLTLSTHKNSTESYTLDRSILWYVNYISIKLFKMKLQLSMQGPKVNPQAN